MKTLIAYGQLGLAVAMLASPVASCFLPLGELAWCLVVSGAVASVSVLVWLREHRSTCLKAWSFIASPKLLDKPAISRDRLKKLGA
jgi:hypothetical protein